MVRRLVLLLVLTACTTDAPPPITDSDGGPSLFDDDAYAPPVFIDSGVDAGVTEILDFEGSCSSGFVPVWHFFDFQTHTPSDSALVMTVATAETEAALDSTDSVALAKVTGPDITTWTGVDVATKIAASLLFLRVSITFVPASDGTAPVLVHYRQEYDCVVQ